MLFKYFRALREKYVLYRLSPVGRIIYGYLHDPVFRWQTDNSKLWIDDSINNDHEPWPARLYGPSPSSTSPCILYISSQENFGDNRVTLTATDKRLLWALIHPMLQRLQAVQYAELKDNMVIRKLKGK